MTQTYKHPHESMKYWKVVRSTGEYFHLTIGNFEVERVITEEELIAMGFEKVEPVQSVQEKELIGDTLQKAFRKYCDLVSQGMQQQKAFEKVVLEHMPKSKEECSDTSVESLAEEHCIGISYYFDFCKRMKQEVIYDKLNMKQRFINFANALAKSEDTPANRIEVEKEIIKWVRDGVIGIETLVYTVMPNVAKEFKREIVEVQVEDTPIKPTTEEKPNMMDREGNTYFGYYGDKGELITKEISKKEDKKPTQDSENESNTTESSNRIEKARSYFDNGIDAKYLGARKDKFREAIEKFQPVTAEVYNVTRYYNKLTGEESHTINGVDMDVIEDVIKNKKDMKRKYEEIMNGKQTNETEREKTSDDITSLKDSDRVEKIVDAATDCADAGFDRNSFRRKLVELLPLQVDTEALRIKIIDECIKEIDKLNLTQVDEDDTDRDGLREGVARARGRNDAMNALVGLKSQPLQTTKE